MIFTNNYAFLPFRNDLHAFEEVVAYLKKCAIYCGWKTKQDFPVLMYKYHNIYYWFS